MPWWSLTTRIKRRRKEGDLILEELPRITRKNGEEMHWNTCFRKGGNGEGKYRIFNIENFVGIKLIIGLLNCPN